MYSVDRRFPVALLRHAIFIGSGAGLRILSSRLRHKETAQKWSRSQILAYDVLSGYGSTS